MIWEGLSDHQLCELFKDRQQNGHRTVDQIVEHMHTPLVLWGWHPGEGRTPIPYSEKGFLENVKVWAENGAVCPANPIADDKPSRLNRVHTLSKRDQDAFAASEQ